MTEISVVVITYNEEKNIERCLQSVKGIADEILVVDSLSTDRTVALAEQYGAKVIPQAFLGHVEQKNFAADNAKYNWVLSLDADEALSPELQESIRRIKASGTTADAYSMNRLTNYCGTWIKHSGWYPDRKIRLFNKSKGNWKGENPHDRWELSNIHDKVAYLKGDIQHYSFYTFSDHLKKIERYTEIAARARVAKGKNYSLIKIIIVPGWTFFINYLIRLGFMDGYHGLVVCRMQAFETFMKYNKVRQYARMKKEGKSF